MRNTAMGVRPVNAKRFAGKKIGDCVWSCGEVVDGAQSQLVVRVSDDGYLRILYEEDGEDFDGKMEVGWAVDFHYETPAEAVRARALEDLDYCEPLVAAARKVLEIPDSQGDNPALYKSILTLNFSVRAYNVIRALIIGTVPDRFWELKEDRDVKIGELVGVDAKTLLQQRNCAQRTVDEIRSKLRDVGLALKGE